MARLILRLFTVIASKNTLQVSIVDSCLGVRNASWAAAYDIRVDMNAKEKPVTLIYRAGIKQNTGEVRMLRLKCEASC